MRRRARFATWLATLAATAGMRLSAAPPYEGRPVVKIEFLPAAQPLTESYLREILPVSPGEPLRAAQVRTAIERLYATGRYRDIVVEALPAAGGVMLQFVTRPELFTGRVVVEGVPEPPNRGVLVNATGLELGAPFRESDLKRAGQDLTALLRQNGFFQSRLEPRFEHRPGTNQVEVRFVVASGPRARYAPPQITGAPEKEAPGVARWTHWKGWLGWKAVTENRTQDGLERIRKALREQGRLSSEVTLKGLDYDPAVNRVKPSIEVRPGARVRVRATGVKLSQGKLKRLAPVFEEQSLDRDLLMEGARNIREYFQGQGYFDAQVDFQVRPSGPGEELVEYAVKRGERHKLAAVLIEGNRYFSGETLRERMYVRPAALPGPRHGRYSEELLQRDLASITALYASNGFRDARLSSTLERSYRGRHDAMAVRITVQEGPQWRVSSLALSGPAPERLEAVRALLYQTEGQPFSESNVSIDRDNLLDYYFNQGFPDAAFEWSFEPAGQAGVKLAYRVREGARKYVRGVLVSGLERTDPGLVSERLALEPGEPLSRAEVLAAQSRLYNLGIFARVDVALENPEGEERDKLLLVNLDESSRYAVTGGLGAEIRKIGGCRECLDKPVGDTGFSPRVYFDVTRRNAFGAGHIVSFKSRLSTVQKRGIVSYEAPQFRGRPDLSLLFSSMYEDARDVRTFSARRQEGSVQLGQKLSRASQALYRFTYRRVSVDPETLQINSLLIPLFSQPVRLGIVAGNFIQDRRDEPTDSRRGVYNTLDAGWASKAFGSQANFTRLLGHNTTYHAWGMGHRFVLARSATFGWLHRLDSEKLIPLPERFFSGGAASHRGFPESQAGPRDLLTGFPLGGRALVLNQLELRFPLLGENLRGVLFEDAGNVYTSLRKVTPRVRQDGVADFDYMVHAAGFGVRYRTPVGPVRLDVAYTLNPPSFVGFKGTREQLLLGGGVRTRQQLGHFQFHFSLGQAF